ncbi:MAG: lamin tail domain-containing protein [candidate division Zixibacteria bacterium]|nr:lamin tail domain-containing protein [candidate division Zixibacteria bacterium]
MLKAKVFVCFVVVFVACQLCLANPIPDKYIGYINVDPPEIGIYSLDEFDISGALIITASDTATVNSEVIVPSNWNMEPLDEPFILNSSNTSGFIINSEGDFISIFPEVNYYIEPVYFGQPGLFPAPIAGHPIELYVFNSPYEPMTQIFHSYSDAFPSWGWHDEIVLNEINTHNTKNNVSNFIELYNKTDSELSLSGWRLVCDAVYDLPNDALIPAHGFYVLEENTFPDLFDMDYHRDNIYLVRYDSLVDQVGWSSDHGEDVAFMRFPDGDAEADTGFMWFFNDFKGYNDATSSTFENGFPTPGAPNRYDCPGFVVINTHADSIGSSEVRISWTNPLWDDDFELSVLVKRTDRFPVNYNDGEVLYLGTDRQFKEMFIPLNTTVYYTLFARKNDGSYSSPTDESRASFRFGSTNIDKMPLPLKISSINCYPNPFNAQTKILFTLANDSYIKLSVYDITGRLVDILSEGRFTTGKHAIVWNASDKPSGVYFYSLQSDEFTQTKRLVLLK